MSDPIPLPLGTDSSPERLKRLYELHMERYGTMLRRAMAGEPNYRPDELRTLLKVWRTVSEKAFVYADLPSEAQSEVYDAIGDEEG